MLQAGSDGHADILDAAMQQAAARQVLRCCVTPSCVAGNDAVSASACLELLLQTYLL